MPSFATLVGVTTDHYTHWRAEITHRREHRGYSAAQAASHAGISSQRWRNLERGYENKAGTTITANPSRLTVVKMARAVGWDPAEALAEAGFDPPRPHELDRSHTRTRDDLDEYWAQLSEPDRAMLLSLAGRLANDPAAASQADYERAAFTEPYDDDT